MRWWKVAEELTPALAAGDLPSCDARVSEEIASLPQSPFHLALDLHFSDPPEEVAAYFESFLDEQRRSFPVGAVYTETNGFDLNPDLWYFDPFAYRKYGGQDDMDWIAYWDSGDAQSMTLHGMEPLQEVYASPAFQDENHREVSYLSSLLVVVRFQTLIQRAAPMIDSLDCPLLATSHDYDFIYEYRPAAFSPAGDG